MIAEAKKRSPDARICYRVSDLEQYEYPEETWDCVISNLALHYIEDLDRIYRNVHRTLKKGGTFLFNIEHPVYTAREGQDWIFDEKRQPAVLACGRLLLSGEKTHPFSRMRCREISSHTDRDYEWINQNRIQDRVG